LEGKLKIIKNINYLKILFTNPKIRFILKTITILIIVLEE